MKFDFVIGNPPYQEDMEGTSDRPVYNLFMDASYSVATKSLLITPARFLFNAGKTPKIWNQKMLSDPHLKVMHFEQNSATVFNNTEIKGGVAITYRDEDVEFGAIEHFIPDDTLRGILLKVKSFGIIPFSKIVNATEYYKLTDVLHEENPSAKENMSNGHQYDLTSNLLDKNAGLFYNTCPEDGYKYVRIFGRQAGKRIYVWVKSSYIQPCEGLKGYKVIIPESNNNGTFGETLVDPIVGDPDVATTQTFLSIGFFSERDEAEAARKYIMGKFARAMLGTLKITQHNKKDTWRNVPLQDFTPASDIDWSQPIPAIDRQLYRKYGLTEDEVAFIESHVKEMT